MVVVIALLSRMVNGSVFFFFGTIALSLFLAIFTVTIAVVI
jgi:hypothetical protein